ncbi:MAG TPA: ankyrin repeat domain-containing protein [Pyrinomonadaceae bacterium]
MPRQLPKPHELLRVSEPCSVEWGSMSGDVRSRFCAQCQRHVHTLSEVTPVEALDLVLRSGGRLCMRIERDPSGVPRTRALVEPLYQIGRRASRLAAGAFGAALTICSATGARAQTPEPSPPQQVVNVNPTPEEVKPEAGATQGTTAAEQNPEEVKVITETAGIIVMPLSEPLVKAADDNDLDAVKRLLIFEGADVNVVDGMYGTSALAHAVRNGNREMIRELLWRGARVNLRLTYKQTALMHLSEETSAEAVRDLLDAGAKVNVKDEEDNTPLIIAAGRGRAEVVELLLKYGAKHNAQNKEGRTALMNAAASGNTGAVRVLLQAGADYTRRDAQGHTALWHARDNESEEAAALLLSYGAPNEPKEEP